MKAVILAAGKGTRLKPLTDVLPKALIPLNGKPILEIILEQLKSVGIIEIIIIVNHLQEQIKDHFQNGEKLGMTLQYVEQKEMLGTANALLQAESFIDEEKFICLACDSLFETDLLKKLLNNKSGGVITAREVEDGRRFGILLTNNKKVLKILEKPENPPSNLANLSVYLLPREIFSACKFIPASKTGEYYLPDAIKLLIDQGITFEYELSKHIIDIGTHEQLKEAEKLAKGLGL